MSYKWYFVRCQSGREDSIRKQLETRIRVAGLQDVVPQILVPFERVTDMKAGKRRVVVRGNGLDCGFTQFVEIDEAGGDARTLRSPLIGWSPFGGRRRRNRIPTVPSPGVAPKDPASGQPYAARRTVKCGEQAVARASDLLAAKTRKMNPRDFIVMTLYLPPF